MWSWSSYFNTWAMTQLWPLLAMWFKEKIQQTVPFPSHCNVCNCISYGNGSLHQIVFQSLLVNYGIKFCGRKKHISIFRYFRFPLKTLLICDSFGLFPSSHPVVQPSAYIILSNATHSYAHAQQVGRRNKPINTLSKNTIPSMMCGL